MAGSAMKIGTAPISWGVCELPDWGVVLPYERVLDEMAELGYAGTELGPWGYLPKDPATLAPLLRERGLSLAGAFCPVTLHIPARYEEQFAYAMDTCRLLAALGAPVLVLAEAGDAQRERIAGRVRDVDPCFSEEEWHRFAEGAEVGAPKRLGPVVPKSIEQLGRAHKIGEEKDDRLPSHPSPAQRRPTSRPMRVWAGTGWLLAVAASVYAPPGPSVAESASK